MKQQEMELFGLHFRRQNIFGVQIRKHSVVWNSPLTVHLENTYDGKDTLKRKSCLKPPRNMVLICESFYSFSYLTVLVINVGIILTHEIFNL